MREMLPLLKAKGDSPSLASTILLNLPAGLLAFIGQRFLGGNELMTFIMGQIEVNDHAGHELTALYARDVLADARRLGVPLPRLTALEPVFMKK